MQKKKIYEHYVLNDNFLTENKQHADKEHEYISEANSWR